MLIEVSINIGRLCNPNGHFNGRATKGNEIQMKITPTTPRTTIQVRFVNEDAGFVNGNESFIEDKAYEAERGTTIEQFINAADLQTDAQITAALMNGRLRELSHPLQQDAVIKPITTAISDGSRIYRRSLSFLMVAAATELFPDHTISIQHSMPFGGYYCEMDGTNISDTDLDSLRTRMRQLIAENLPITQIQLPLDEAIQIFEESGDTEKAKLFSKRRKDYLTVYELNGIRDYFHGFMVPSTGYLSLFDLRPYNHGFILQFPRRQAPTILQPFADEPRLARVFQEYDDWLRVIGSPGVASLNEIVENGRVQETILVAEALHQRQLTNITTAIAARRHEVRIVLISGPSSAGKTTFSKRLAIQLLAAGIRPVAIGMDNYFVDRDKTPLDENGDLDFETIEAVNVKLFRQHMHDLLDGKTIIQPIFDFHSGTSSPGDPLQLGADEILIIEGIHGLNPRLVEGIDSSSLYRIFISAFTQLNLDKHNRVPTTDTRLIRRIVRDAAHRGYTAADTIGRWPSVRRGEKRHIFPHESNADVFFNSALVYEMSVLKLLAYPLLLQVEPGTKERIEANRLLAFLQWFDPIPEEDLRYIASDSILREFIGGSVLRDYEPWK